jgi:hypothetical protein
MFAATLVNALLLREVVKQAYGWTLSLELSEKMTWYVSRLNAAQPLRMN